MKQLKIGMLLLIYTKNSIGVLFYVFDWNASEFHFHCLDLFDSINTQHQLQAVGVLSTDLYATLSKVHAVFSKHVDVAFGVTCKIITI